MIITSTNQVIISKNKTFFLPNRISPFPKENNINKKVSNPKGAEKKLVYVSDCTDNFRRLSVVSDFFSSFCVVGLKCAVLKFS